MKLRRSVAPIPWLFVCAALASTTPRAAFAQDAAASSREAGRHFERGVTLYGETDYRGALVEFRRAYGIAPNAAVLFDIGQAQFQLQDYAGALAAFTRFLAEAPPSDNRRAEAERNLEVLRVRVGHMTLVTTPPGADVSLDDQPIGKTPLEEHLLVSVGHHKVTATIQGHLPATRYVDVAAEDQVSVTLDLPLAVNSPGPASGRISLAPPPPSSTGPALRTAGFITTGLFAAGAGVAGTLALRESSNLEHARATFPTSSSTLQHDSNLTMTYSVIADSLTAAAVLVGGITLYSTLTSAGSKSRRTEQPSARVWIGPSSANFAMTF